jgi:putative ABC transport system permease protein
VLAAAVGLVLLVACANVTNLVLSRGVARQRELALRAALGASRGRLVQQLLVETAVLCVTGGVCGILTALVLVRLLPTLAPPGFPRLEAVQLDTTVLGVALASTVVALLLAGVLPAWRGARDAHAEALRGGDGASAEGFRGRAARRLRDGLLVAEAAFAVMLLVGAALLAHSFVRLIRVDAGYDAEHVLTARVQLPRTAPPERSAHVVDAVLTRLRSLPGVVAAGAGTTMPFTSLSAITMFSLRPEGTTAEPVTARALTYVVTPGYAEALNLRLRAGRPFTEQDASSGVRTILVNEEFARQYLGPALDRGETLSAGGRSAATAVVGGRFGPLYLGEQDVTSEIVGVVGNVLKDGNDRAPQPEIYFAHGTRWRRIRGFINFVVRTTGDPSAMTATLRQALREADSTVVIERIDPLTDLASAAVDQPRFATGVLGLFAALAVALAAVGLYGVLAYSVTQRRRELGVRAALGASRPDLLRLVIGEGLAVTSVGLVVGLIASTGLAQALKSLLFGIGPLDAVAFAAGPLVLLPVALAACVLPALRAASIDPASTLRAD